MAPSPEQAEQQTNLKTPLTPFRRNRPRVVYSSDSLSSSSPEERETVPERMFSKDPLRIKISVPNNTLIRRCKTAIGRPRPSSCTGHPSPDEFVSSADEATGNFCSEENSPVCSPTGSLRGSHRSSSNGSWRGSPSQRSQDSGYSDSGESNSGIHNEPEDASNQAPQVRHITRIYFGDSNRQTSTCDKSNNTDENDFSPSFAPKSSCSSTPRTIKMGKRRSTCSISNSSTPLNNVNTIHISNSLDRTIEHNKSTKSLCTPTTSSTFDLEKEDALLEHKSLSDVSSLTTTPQYSFSTKKLSKITQKTLSDDQRQSELHNQAYQTSFCKSEKTSSRNYRKVSQGRRGPRRSTSSDKLLEEDLSCKPRRPEPLKARRRWSSSDLDRCSTSRETPFSTLTENVEEVDNVHSRTFPYCESYECSSSPITRQSPFKIAENLGNSSLQQWLGELRRLCESECLNTLQSKSLHVEQPQQGAISAHATLANIQKRAHVVSAEFALLCQRLELLQLDQVPSLVRTLVAYVQTFIRTHCLTSTSDSKEFDLPKPSSLRHQVRVVDQICDRLIEICSESFVCSSMNVDDSCRRVDEEVDEEETEESYSSFSHSCRSPSRFESQILLHDGQINRGLIREFVQIVTALGHAFTKLVDIILSLGMKTLVSILEEGEEDRGVESAITEVTALGLSGGHVCRLVGRVGGIRALLGVCLEPRFKRIRPLALRALATVCCISEGISFFEKEGGIDVIAEVLCDKDSPEEERSEAAGVLAQITSPWVEDNHSLPCLKPHMKQIVNALTELGKTTSSAEVFLLTSAALANLTFLDLSCIDDLLSSGTHRVLLQKAQEEENLSLFTKDQIATILANMSSAPEAAKQIVNEGGIEVLLSLLATEPTFSLRHAEIAATERVQQKSAIALSRICTDPNAANEVFASGGAARLVHLCKNEKERNHSDAVLVACLAALRKMASWCGEDELRRVDACELVEPRLLDSFLTYSSQQESFV